LSGVYSVRLMNRLFICGLGLLFSSGCSSKPSVPAPQQHLAAPLHALFIPVENPVGEMCRDDTFSLTEWFNVPVARFAGTAINLNGRDVTADGLYGWAEKYYERKSDRVLYVQIEADSMANAEHALEPIVRLYPSFMVRRVEVGFTCPKLHR